MKMKSYERTTWENVKRTIQFHIIPDFKPTAQRLKEMWIENKLVKRDVDINVRIDTVSCYMGIRERTRVKLMYLGKIDNHVSFATERAYLNHIFNAPFGELQTGRTSSYHFQGPDAITGKYVAERAEFQGHKLRVEVHVPWYPDSCTIVEDKPDYKLVCNVEID